MCNLIQRFFSGSAPSEGFLVKCYVCPVWVRCFDVGALSFPRKLGSVYDFHQEFVMFVWAGWCIKWVQNAIENHILPLMGWRGRRCSSYNAHDVCCVGVRVFDQVMQAWWDFVCDGAVEHQCRGNYVHILSFYSQWFWFDMCHLVTFVFKVH